MSNTQLFHDIERHIMEDEKPSVYLNELLNKGMLDEYPFAMLKDLTHVEQNLKWHPEGNVWNHTMLVVDQAAKRRDKSENPRAFMWAALLHDIGKAPTTRERKGKLTAYNHERVGKKMAIEFLKEFTEDKEFIERVAALIRWHMEALFALKNLPMSNIKGMLQEVSLEEIALLCICDRFGRGEMSQEKMEDEEKGIEMFVEKCKKVRSEIKPHLLYRAKQGTLH